MLASRAKPDDHPVIEDTFAGALSGPTEGVAMQVEAFGSSLREEAARDLHDREAVEPSRGGGELEVLALPLPRQRQTRLVARPSHHADRQSPVTAKRRRKSTRHWRGEQARDREPGGGSTCTRVRVAWRRDRLPAGAVSAHSHLNHYLPPVRNQRAKLPAVAEGCCS